MDFPAKLTHDDLKLRVKEWILMGWHVVAMKRIDDRVSGQAISIMGRAANPSGERLDAWGLNFVIVQQDRAEGVNKAAYIIKKGEWHLC